MRAIDTAVPAEQHLRVLPYRTMARLLVALVAAVCLVVPGASRAETHPTGHDLTISAATTAHGDLFMSVPEGQGKLPLATPQLAGKPAPSFLSAPRLDFGAPDRAARFSLRRARSDAPRRVQWVGTVELRI